MILKLKSHEHWVSTQQTTLKRVVSENEELMALAERLLHWPRPPTEPVRLLGLSVSSGVDREEEVRLAFEFEE